MKLIYNKITIRSRKAVCNFERKGKRVVISLYLSQTKIRTPTCRGVFCLIRSNDEAFMTFALEKSKRIKRNLLRRGGEILTFARTHFERNI